MEQRKIKQIEVERSLPSMVYGLTDDTTYIIRIGIANASGDYDAAFATIYGPRLPKYGEHQTTEPTYEPCTFVEVRISGLQRAIAEQRSSFSEEKMYSTLLAKAEAKAIEIVENWPSDRNLPQNDYVSLTAQDINS